jgi:phage terminase small subunit
VVTVALTEKQKRFVSEYLVDLNATQAAIRAGYSTKTADRIGAELLGKTWVAEEIQKAIKKREQRTNITQDRVLEELAAIAFARATDFVSIEDGIVSFVDTFELTDAQRRAISFIEKGANGIKLRLHDKVKALEQLGKHLGMFDGNTSQAKTASQVDSHNALIEAIRSRSHED